MHFIEGFGPVRRFEGGATGVVKDPAAPSVKLDATGALAGDLIPSPRAARPHPTVAARPTMHLVRAWTGEAAG